MEKLPKSALSYYVKLYCKKRKTKQHDDNKINLLAEATRSWLKLSASKKKIFLMKYNNCHLKLRKRFAEKLRKAISITNQRNEIVEIPVDLINKSTTQNDLLLGDPSVKDLQDINLVNQTSSLLNNSDHTEKYASNNVQNVSKLSIDETMVEPIPPAFRKSQELYNIIKKNSDDVIPWQQLTNAQKAPYVTAAGRIKRLYLMEYTNYIENLSDESLLAHYRNKIKN